MNPAWKKSLAPCLEKVTDSMIEVMDINYCGHVPRPQIDGVINSASKFINAINNIMVYIRANERCWQNAMRHPERAEGANQQAAASEDESDEDEEDEHHQCTAACHKIRGGVKVKWVDEHLAQDLGKIITSFLVAGCSDPPPE